MSLGKHKPIRGQYSGHVISVDQSDVSIYLAVCLVSCEARVGWCLYREPGQIIVLFLHHHSFLKLSR